MRDPVTVACAQAEPVLFDRAATIDRIAELAAEVARNGTQLVLFPETFIPVYPSNRWVRFLAGGQDTKSTYAKLARESLEVPGEDSTRIGEIAREHSLWLAVGANELDRDTGTIYNA